MICSDSRADDMVDRDGAPASVSVVRPQHAVAKEVAVSAPGLPGPPRPSPRQG